MDLPKSFKTTGERKPASILRLLSVFICYLNLYTGILTSLENIRPPGTDSPFLPNLPHNYFFKGQKHRMSKSKKGIKSDKKSMGSAEAKGQEAETSTRSPFREVAEIAFYGLTILIFMKGFVWQNFQIPTKSMENTLLIGDHITANTFMFKASHDWEKVIFPFRDIRRGDVVVFKWPGDDRQDWIKRCIGLPGDEFELKGDQLFVNGTRLDQPFAYFKDSFPQYDRDPNNSNYPLNFDTEKPGIDNANPNNVGKSYSNAAELKKRTKNHFKGPTFTNFEDRDQELFQKILDRLDSAPEGVIPEGFYMMMGDNRSHSMDSRTWGLVPKEFIEGRAYWIWWSYGEDENSHTKKGGDFVMSYVRVAWRFFTHTHFNRTFKLIR